uniref:Uncharacterized protein n=1 Tax=Rhizophora mucronata TaxID=61149 RepID=A0A2P2QMM3_RHIMU
MSLGLKSIAFSSNLS